MSAATLLTQIGQTPLICLSTLPGTANARRGNRIFLKLEGGNPAGSIKDRAALSMIERAEARGRIKPGDALIEPTSGNTGIALAMIAAARGYRLTLVMPENQSVERRRTMRAFGARLVLTPTEGGMELSRDIARTMADSGEGFLLDQFSNPDNAQAHFETTGPEIWTQTEGQITHFVATMGTTGTLTGTSRFLKAQNPKIITVGSEPDDDSDIPGIRKWPDAYRPKIFDAAVVDVIDDVAQGEAEEMTRRLAREEGLFVGISTGCALASALRQAEGAENALIVAISADRGDRYLSTGVFPT
ncbi:MAG: cysteine synthase CysM [Zoogloeaceae bacterium]|jgi:cysteine synthase B|nr:cysteine synthase CysM [Zoogloeaceae bacterium]